MDHSEDLSQTNMMCAVNQDERKFRGFEQLKLQIAFVDNIIFLNIFIHFYFYFFKGRGKKLKMNLQFSALPAVGLVAGHSVVPDVKVNISFICKFSYFSFLFPPIQR